MKMCHLIKYIWSRYLTVSVITVLALLYAITGAVFRSSATLNIPPNWVAFGELGLNVCYSIIAAYIFFVFQVVIPEENNYEKLMPYIYKRVSNYVAEYSSLIDYYRHIYKWMNADTEKDDDGVVHFKRLNDGAKEKYIIKMRDIAKLAHRLNGEAVEMIESSRFPQDFVDKLIEIYNSELLVRAELYYDRVIVDKDKEDSILIFLQAHIDTIYCEETYRSMETLKNELKLCNDNLYKIFK